MPKDPKLDQDATFIPRAPAQKGADGEWATVIDGPPKRARDEKTTDPLKKAFEEETLRSGSKQLREIEEATTQRGVPSPDVARTQRLSLSPGDAPETLRLNEAPNFTPPDAPADTMPPDTAPEHRETRLKPRSPAKPVGTFILPPQYKAEQPKPQLVDTNTRLLIAAAASITFLVGVIAWKLLGPAKEPAPPRLNIPTVVVTPVAPADKKAPDPAVTAKSETVMIEDKVDAGFGQTRTVKVEGATVQLTSSIEVMLSRNGAEIGKTPLLVTLPVGTVTLQAVNKDQGLNRSVSVEIDRSANQVKRLEFPRGRIEVRAPAGAKLSLDGRPVSAGSVAAWPGSHTVDVVFASGDKDSRKVDVVAGDNVSVEFEAPVRDQQLAQ